MESHALLPQAWVIGVPFSFPWLSPTPVIVTPYISLGVPYWPGKFLNLRSFLHPEQPFSQQTSRRQKPKPRWLPLGHEA